jgi:hypothetical protein
MVMKIFRYTFYVGLFLISFAIISCKDNTTDNSVDCSTYDYSDCNSIQPFEGNMHVKLTINSENPAVPLTIYQGKLEDGVVVLRDTVSGSTYDTLLPIDNFYTVTARYVKGSSTIIAVDGDKISSSNTVTCDSNCWNVKPGSVNVRLK